MDNLIINRLPVKTWRYLRLNGHETEIPLTYAASVDSRVTADGCEIVRAGLPEIYDEIEKRLGAPRRENFVAGKETIYNDQPLMTGMGKDADDLIKSVNPYCVRITADKKEITEPITLKVTGNGLIYINAEKGSRSVFVIDADEADILSVKLIGEPNSDTEIRLSHIGKKRDSVICDFGAYLETDARLTLRQLALVTKDINIGIGVDLSGDRSSFNGSLAYLRRGGEYEDINYNIIQRGKATDSVFDVKGVLFSKGNKTLRDTIDFRRGSAGSKASEQENVLLAESDESGIINRSIPLILCEEEDVDGRHGASIGRIDPDVLTYMTSRGFDISEAKKLLIRGHIGSVARAIGGKTAEQTEDYLDRLLEKSR